jgi:hypothetical protein
MTELVSCAAGAGPPSPLGTARPLDRQRCAVLLLESAVDVRLAAGTPGSARAITGSLGPLEAALENLERAAHAMEAVAEERLFHATVVLGGRWNDVSVADLGRALANACRARQTARACGGPILAELRAI